MVTNCYSPSCQGVKGCYAFSCPYKSNADSFITNNEPSTARAIEAGPSGSGAGGKSREWTEAVDPQLLQLLPDQERRRQTIIHQAILAEEQYKTDLNAIETVSRISSDTPGYWSKPHHRFFYPYSFSSVH